MSKSELNIVKAIKLSQTTEISLNTDVFNIFVKPSTNDELKVTVNLVLAKEIAFNLSDTEIIELNYDEESNRVSFSINSSDVEKFAEHNSILKSNLKVEIPDFAISTKEKLLDIETIHSDINLEDINANFILKTTNGDIKINKSSDGKVFSTNGDIKISDSTGVFTLSAVNGDIKILNCEGKKIDLNNENGDIKAIDSNFRDVCIKSNNGDVYCKTGEKDFNVTDISTVNGDIQISINNNNSDQVKLFSANGDIKISVPGELLFNLDLETVHGDISCKIDSDKSFETIIDENRYFVNYSDDILSIKAHSTHGDIKVKEDDYAFFIFLENEINKAEDLLSKLADTKTAEHAKEIIDSIYQSLNDTIFKIKDKISGEESQKYQERIFKLIEQIKTNINKESFDDVVHKTKESFNDLSKKFSSIIENFKDKPFNIYKHSENKPSKWNKVFNTDNEAIMKVLDMLEKKCISAEEAENLIKTLKK